MFSTFTATLNTCLMRCQIYIQKALFGVFSRALAKFITAQSVDLRFGGVGWGVGERETEEGGVGDPETSRPTDLTAIYHSESMCQQLCACFMVDRLPLPPSLPPPPSVQSCMGTLCVCT